MIFSKKIKLNIENPCSESWEGMAITNNGRFCGACSKNVLDFSNMTEKQLTDYFKTNKSGLCGRFKSTQLDKTYLIQSDFQLSNQKRFFRYFMTFLLSSKAFFNKVIGQTDTVTVLQNDTLPKIVENDTILTDSNKVAVIDSINLKWEWENEADTVVWAPKEGVDIITVITVMGYMPSPHPSVPQIIPDFLKSPQKKLTSAKNIIIATNTSPSRPSKPEKENTKMILEAILPEELRIKSEKKF